jgi:methionine aminopeptidase
VAWFFRDKIQERNLSTWNHPRVSVVTPETTPGWTGSDSVINEGDVLHVDYGISALGMHTDTQHFAYVLRTSKGETEPPPGLTTGFRKANRMQDIQLELMRPGMTGNAILSAILARMKEEGLEGQVFSHPIGEWGHAPGAVMGK